MNEHLIDLKKKIEEFRSIYLSKDEIIVFEENGFDKIIGKLFNFLSIKFKVIFDIFMKILDNFLEFITKHKVLEKKILKQEEVIRNNAKINSVLSQQISLLNKKIDNFSLEKNLNRSLKNSITSNDDNEKNVFNNTNTNIEFYQNENLRLSKELYDVQKKALIMKEEIEKFEEQRANLVTKMNSVNEVIKDTNVLTNVFENSVKKNQIEILDYKAEQNNNIKKNLSEEIEKIFSNK